MGPKEGEGQQQQRLWRCRRRRGTAVMGDGFVGEGRRRRRMDCKATQARDGSNGHLLPRSNGADASHEPLWRWQGPPLTSWNIPKPISPLMKIGCGIMSWCGLNV
ncbi:hypothetical protein EJB05_19659 [Eragrostis curvula]|uniref:Uncharacterized protein n=1 Tax=Eragrostis curvula TaxID=38414 RepID=A0A5J9UYM3_9POAL|nr:hypothetical protein EJB05_19659 [Eragrostis curvula]